MVDFLIKMGVPRATAEYDAEGIEHHISTATLQAFEDYARDDNS